MTEQEKRAKQVFDMTRSLANGNMVVQGISGLIGLGANLVVDVAAIPFYVDLWKDIRKVYGRGEITLESAGAILKPNLGFLASDFFWDKIMGTIPVVGAPFNAAFAKALTWRLGAWFGLMSALGEDKVPNEILIRTTMQLTSEIFPSVGNVFTFKTPDEVTFIQFISAQDGLTLEESKRRTAEALKILKGG